MVCNEGCFREPIAGRSNLKIDMTRSGDCPQSIERPPPERRLELMRIVQAGDDDLRRFLGLVNWERLLLTESFELRRIKITRFITKNASAGGGSERF